MIEDDVAHRFALQKIDFGVYVSADTMRKAESGGCIR